jgi:hypothetical protein
LVLCVSDDIDIATRLAPYGHVQMAGQQDNRSIISIINSIIINNDSRLQTPPFDLVKMAGRARP